MLTKSYQQFVEKSVYIFKFYVAAIIHPRFFAKFKTQPIDTVWEEKFAPLLSAAIVSLVLVK